MTTMEKAYHIEYIILDSDFLVLKADNLVIKLKLADISEKLAHATIEERNDYKISPSGYGIHWRQLDEDLSVNGLIQTFKSLPYPV